jgi:hypothetical protein
MLHIAPLWLTREWITGLTNTNHIVERRDAIRCWVCLLQHRLCDWVSNGYLHIKCMLTDEQMTCVVASPVIQKRAGAQCMHLSLPLFPRCTAMRRHPTFVDTQPHWVNEGWPGPGHYLGLCKFVKSLTHPKPGLGSLCPPKWITATSTVTT